MVVPTQLVLPLAGFLVGQGRFSFVPVLVASTVGGGVASIALYFPGLWVGEERVRQFIDKFGRFVFVKESDLNKASKLFKRHNVKAVLNRVRRAGRRSLGDPLVRVAPAESARVTKLLN